MSYKKFLKGIGISEFVSFDLETTGLNNKSDYIIEFGAVKVKDGVIVDTMHHLVKPPIPIPEFIIKLTGIDDAMVKNASKIDDLIDEWWDFFGDLPLIAHNIAFDVGFLREKRLQIDGASLDNELLDTLPLAQTFRYDLVNHKLGTVAEFYGVSAEGAHRADFDAKLVAEIFLHLLSEMARMTIEQLQTIISILKSTSHPNQYLFVNMVNWMLQGHALEIYEKWENRTLHNLPNIRESDDDSSIHSIDEIFENNGILSQQLDHYEARPAQIEMANDVKNAFIDKEILIAEAGTGVGKSLAYTVPAILFREELEETEPIVISCNTKNLQDQLFHKEIPFIQHKLKQPVKAVLIKGRSNYLCKTKWQRSLRDIDWRFTDSDKLNLSTIVMWVYETLTGDIDEHNGFSVARNRVWSQLCCEPGFCTTSICSGNGYCYLGKIRKVAYSADILVVNHSLLLSDASADHAILPGYSRLIVDEAHLLEKSAYQFFANEFSYFSIKQHLDTLFYEGRKKTGLLVDLKHHLVKHDGSWKNKVADQIDYLQDDIHGLQSTTVEFFKRFRLDYDNELQNAKFTYKRLFHAHDGVFENTRPELYKLVTELSEVSNSLQRIIKAIQNVQEEIDAPSIEEWLTRALSTSMEIEGSLNIIDSITSAEKPEMIYWLEISPNQSDVQIRFIQVKLNIGEELHSKLFQDIDAAILTSATLKINNNFEYFLKRVGLLNHPKCVTREYSSPFNYEKQARAFVPTFFGNNYQPDYNRRVLNVLDAIWEKNEVGTLILFTSYSMLMSWEKALEPHFKHKKRTLLVQNNRTSRIALVNEFKKKKGSVLLATDSFWQGIDVPGESLQLLVIAKLPFLVPSEPIVKANSEAIKNRGGQDFMEYSVPEAVMKYRQGIGRLIRSTKDFGAVISLDDRIFTKRYGSAFRISCEIPHVSISNENELIDGVTNWFKTKDN